MRDTATGRALLAEGKAEGETRGLRTAIATVIRARLGATPEWLPERLDAIAATDSLYELLRAVARVDTLAQLESIVPPRPPGGRRG